MTLFDLQEASVVAKPTIPHAAIPAVTALEADFPAAFFSRVAEHESWRKEVFRPATSTHKWWAKRLGSIFRGILVSAVSESQAAALAAYASFTKLDDLVVFDPFSGSGTTVVEAAKLGARVAGRDINPVATLVQRQAVQHWDTYELHRAFKLIESACRHEIDRVHCTKDGETVLYYFWVALATCPSCDSDVRLFSNHVFSQNAYPKKVPNAQIVCPECLDIVSGRYDFDTSECSNGHQISRYAAVTRGSMTCGKCGNKSKVLDSLKGNVPRYEMYAKLVLGANGKKRYEPIDDFDRALYAECSRLVGERDRQLVLPRTSLDNGENTKQAIRWGFTEWRHFFNDRQLYSLGILGSSITNLDANVAEREALATLFSGVLEFNNMFCSFKGEGTGAVRHMFSHHILKPERTPLEAHPWGTSASSGSFSTLFQSRLLRAQEYKLNPTDQILNGDKVQRVSGVSQSVEARVVHSWPKQGLSSDQIYLSTGDSAATDIPDSSVDLIVTDPPYMDNVHYSELADFFHSWLREVVPFKGYPADSHTTRSSTEVQSSSPNAFESAIAAVWRECARVLKPGGMIAFTFHQARLSGWVALMKALVQARLVVTAVQPVQGEMSTSITKGGLEPSNLDSIVVCRHADTAHSLQIDVYEAAEVAVRRLCALRASGVTVGAGDVRSVVRGHVLSIYTGDSGNQNLESLAVAADDLANKCIARVLRGGI